MNDTNFVVFAIVMFIIWLFTVAAIIYVAAHFVVKFW